MLCRHYYNAQQALAMGLVNAVVPLDKLDEEVNKWCEDILEKRPTCIQILKATFDDEFNYMRYNKAGDLQKQMFPKFMNSPEQQETWKAFFEKRKPDFSKVLEKNTRTTSKEGEKYE